MAKKKERVIDKSMTFAKIINLAPEIVEILLEKGMHCIGCPMSAQETLKQGALAHGLNPDELVRELNKEINKK